jgi:hypothetical protein
MPLLQRQNITTDKGILPMEACRRWLINKRYHFEIKSKATLMDVMEKIWICRKKE